MDISFHYFAVKTVALAAGYEEGKAQRIASFSEFIDDYNWYAYFRASNIPGYVLAPELDIVFNSLLGLINPVTTGFSDYIDMATLILPRSQRYTVSPFHFIPQNRQSVESGDMRAVPATLNDGSYISSTLNDLKASMDAKGITESDALMQMGSLFHTFADTYAHQLFTGYNNQTNSVVLKSVTDNITGADVTDQYRFWIEKWIEKIESIIKMKMPTIGHMAIGHLPDLTHLSFSMEYQDLQGVKHIHTRSNTETFLKPCKELYAFMRACLEPQGIPLNMPWDTLAEKLAQGFLFDTSAELAISEQAAIAVLTPHWSSVFPKYFYSYNGDAIKKSFIISTSNDIQKTVIDGEELSLASSAYTDDFYKYSMFSDRLLIRLYGDHPRNWLSEERVSAEAMTL